jgi:hypothetical protein
MIICYHVGIGIGYQHLGRGLAFMKTTWKPIAAGVLDIILGCCTLIGGFLFYNFMSVVGAGWEVFAFPAVAGIVAIVGGIYAMQRKIWWLALVGSIAALLPFWFLGVASLILIALSRDEFE